MSYSKRRAKRAIRKAVKQKRGPVSAHKADSREQYYAAKRKKSPPTCESRP